MNLSRLPAVLAHAALVLVLQSPGAQAQKPSDAGEQDRWKALQRLADGINDDSVRRSAAERRAAEESLRQLHEKLAEFVRAWNDFTEEYTVRGTFNLKKARAVNAAWMKLQHDESWPRR